MKGLKIVLISSLIVLSASFVQAQIIVKAKPSAPKVVVVKPNKPGRDYIWIGGRWKVGPNNTYVWVAGSWMQARKGFVWVPGKWRKVRGGWRWVPGYWRKSRGVR